MSVTVSLSFCWVDLEESGVISSLALVEKSLRPASDMVNGFEKYGLNEDLSYSGSVADELSG